MDSDVVDAASSPRLMSSPVSSSTAPRGESPPASPPVSAATSPPPSPPPSAPALFSRTFLSHPVFSQLPGDSQIRRLVGRLRQTNRVRAQAQLCSAIAAHFFTACSYDTALIFYTFDEQLSVETGMEAIDVLIPIRRQGECLCELGEYEDAVKQLQRCESVLQSLGSGTSAKKRHRLQQEVLICRGTAWLSWSDDAQTPAHESRKRVVKAQQCYQMALSLAQQLCGTGKKAKRSKGDAEMLAGSYENLGTAVVQLLYFDNVELDNRRRQHSTNSNNDTLIIDDSTTQPSAPLDTSPYDPLTSPPYALDSLSTATLKAHKQARFECASGLFDEAIAIAEECGLLEYSVRSLHNLGTLYEKMELWDEAISFLNTAILRIQDAAPRSVRMVDRIKHELSTRCVLVHMCTRAGRYELAVEEASKAVRRARELDSGIEDARNDLKLAADVAARVVAISTVEEHVAEREEAVRLEERRTSSLSAIDLTSATEEASMKVESPAQVSVSLEAVVAAIPVLLSAVRELHKLSDLHVANARLGVRAMESFERALAAAEKAIDMQRAEVSKFQTAVKQLTAGVDSKEEADAEQSSDGPDEFTSRLTSSERSAYSSLLDSLSRSYAHYGNTRLSFFRQTTLDKSDSSQLRRSRELTLRAFEQAASTANTPLLRAYMLSRQAEVQFNSAVEHSTVMSTLRQALAEADKGGHVLMKERILQQSSGAIDEEQEQVAVEARRADNTDERKDGDADNEQLKSERAELTRQLRSVQQMKKQQRSSLGRELSAIRKLDGELMLEAEEEAQQHESQEQEQEGKEVEVDADVEEEPDVTASSSRRSSRRQPASARQRPTAARKAREILQSGRKNGSTRHADSAAEEKTNTIMLLSDDDEDVVMEEAGEEEDDDVYDPTFVDPRPPPADTANTRSHIRRPAPVLFPARSSSPVPTPSSESAQPRRSRRRPTPPSSPSPPPAATHYDTDDSDAEDDHLGRRTANLVSAMHDRDKDERKEEARNEEARLMRPVSTTRSSSPTAMRQSDKPSMKRTRASRAVGRPVSDDDENFIVEDTVEERSDRNKDREKRASTHRLPPEYSALPTRRSMRETNASGQSWREVCAQMLADRERSRSDEYIMTQSQQVQVVRGAGSIGSMGSRQSSTGRGGRSERAGSTGSRSSQQQAQAAINAAPRLPPNHVERELVMLDAETETVTTRTETQFFDMDNLQFEQQYPAMQPQSQSLPLAARPTFGAPQPAFSDPVVAYRPLRSHSVPRHSVRYEVEDLVDVLALAADADERSQPLTDEELSAISMLALADELVQHIQRRTGRICVISSISHRGELLGADHNALHIYQRHQQLGDRTNEPPLLFIALDHWKPITMLDCYRTLCQSSSSLRIHPLVLQQLQSSTQPTTIRFPKRPPPTLNSPALQPLFQALRVEGGVFNSLSLPAVPLQGNAVAAFARSIRYSQSSFLPLTTRLAFAELLPHAIFSPPPPNQHQEPLPHALVKLSHISMSGVKLPSTHVAELVASFALLPSLAVLDLADTMLTDDCLPGLCFLIQYSNSLTSLNLSRSLFTAQDSGDRSRLVPAFLAAQRLTQLNLSYCHLTLEASTALLPTLVRLQHLDLSALRCLQPPATAPSSFPSMQYAAPPSSSLSGFYSSLYHHLSSPLCCLRTLVVHSVCDIGGQLSGAICLALLAPSCCLQSVEMSDNQLQPTGVRRLLAVLATRSLSLRRLVLDGNRAVGDEAVCSQLMDCIAPFRTADGRQLSERRGQCLWPQRSVGSAKDVVMWRSSGLEELSVKRCGLSVASQKQLLAYINSTHSKLLVHV